MKVPAPSGTQDKTATPTTTTATGGSGGSGGSQTQVQPHTPEWFAIQVLKGLGAPTTNANIRALVAWEAAEGGHWNNSAQFNPLNTTQPMPGYTQTGTQGNIGSYTSWQQGIEATVKTLQNGHYGPILKALMGGHDAGAVAQAVVNSPWGTTSINLDSAGTYKDTSARSGKSATYTSSDTNAHLSESELASQFGFVGDFLQKHPQVHKLVKEAVAQGWDDATFQAKLTQTPWWRKENITGVTNQIASTAASYGLPIGQGAIANWASQIVSGQQTSNDFMRHAQTQAKSLFPYLSQWIDQGHTVDDYYDAYRQVASSTLGVNSAQIDLSKPMWREPLLQVDPKTGDRQPMSLSDWQTFIMRHPKYGFDSSPVAVQQATDFASQLGQMFGATG